MMDSKRYTEVASLMLKGQVYATQDDVFIGDTSLVKTIALLGTKYIENGKIRIVIMEEEK